MVGLVLSAAVGAMAVAFASISATRFNYWRTWCPRLTIAVFVGDIAALALLGLAASLGTRAGGWEPTGTTIVDGLLPAMTANLAVRRRRGADKTGKGDDLLLSLTQFGHDYLEDEIRERIQNDVWAATPDTIERWWAQRLDDLAAFRPSSATTEVVLSLEDKKRILISYFRHAKERRPR